MDKRFADNDQVNIFLMPYKAATGLALQDVKVSSVITSCAVAALSPNSEFDLPCESIIPKRLSCSSAWSLQVARSLTGRHLPTAAAT